MKKKVIYHLPFGFFFISYCYLKFNIDNLITLTSVLINSIMMITLTIYVILIIQKRNVTFNIITIMVIKVTFITITMLIVTENKNS